MEGRIIGRYEGIDPGPLLICIGGMHGNEPAGIKAIEEVFRLLSIEKGFNPGFRYGGVMIGLRGNLAAIYEHKRFINRDLNRMMLPEEFERISKTEAALWTSEEKEFMGLTETIEAEKKKYNPSSTFILDLHTTTADGGLFTIAADDEMSMTLAKGLHTPVILGFAENLKGTTLHYLNKPEENTYCIVFEAGQHNDPGSVHRTASAIVNCMRTIGSVHSRDVDHRHDGLLKGLSASLPRVTRLIYRYHISPDEQFLMNPNYKNFQPVEKGEVVAKNQHGLITAPFSGLLLMPKYQPQGDDGFFIVEVVE